MDKFLIRTPRSNPSVLSDLKQEPRKVQSSLFSLKGVVVVEDLVRAKKLLKEEHVEEERKVTVLRELGEKRPSTELLESTGIGRTVRKLSKEGEGEVKVEATKVYRSWKDAVERRVEAGSSWWNGVPELPCGDTIPSAVAHSLTTTTTYLRYNITRK